MPISKADTRPPDPVPDRSLEARRADDGYSLVEVLVSLAIMATLVGVTGMSLRRPLEALEYKRAVDDLNDVVLQARNLSMVDADNADLARVWLSLREEDDRHQFDFNEGYVGPYGACRAVSGTIILESGPRHPFRIAPVTCQIRLRDAA